jgi:hypothetical protein
MNTSLSHVGVIHSSDFSWQRVKTFSLSRGYGVQGPYRKLSLNHAPHFPCLRNLNKVISEKTRSRTHNSYRTHISDVIVPRLKRRQMHIPERIRPLVILIKHYALP